MLRMGDGAEKVLVAMSGGVDSSVAAYLLRRSGYEVTGVHLRLGGSGESEQGTSGCSAPKDADDAHRVADRLGVELVVLDAGSQFVRIIDYFTSEYARGRTPNPCIHCNALVKFGTLLARAEEVAAGYVATGHHARMVAGQIHRAAEKDQSYALFGLARDQLQRILLPIGQVAGKGEVRRIAAELGLHVADKPDSQEICFVSGDYAELLRRRRPEAFRPGDIVDSTGRVLGRHDGVGNFTIGQRRGLRVARGVPMYVTRIDPDTATVTIGPAEEVRASRLRADGANWHVDPPPPGSEFDAVVQIRYNHGGAPGKVRITSRDSFEVDFPEPVTAVAPGQAAVVYDGDRLLGGGWIDRADPPR